MLSRDLSIFLVQFSIALSKTKTYPAGHPAMTAAVATVLQRLRTVLLGRDELAIGVARHQLILEGRSTDPAHPVLRDLALKLHRNQIVVLRLLPGIELAELSDLLCRLGAEAWRQGKPLGLEAKAELARWPHARLEPLELHQLEIGIADAPLDDASGHAGQLWLGLAAAALLQDQAERDESDRGQVLPSAQAIGHAINERRGDPAYDKVVAGYLLGLGELLAEGSAAETATLRQRLTGLVQAMTPETLGLLLGAGTDLEQRRALLLRAAKALPVDAVLKLLEAAATSTQQNISHAVLRILQKLAAHVDLGDTSPGFGAEAAVRDTVHQLVADMSLEDPNPGTYRRLLSLLSQPRTAGIRPREEHEPHSESLRVVQMSLEIGSTGQLLERAVDELVDVGALTALLDHLDRCEGEPVAMAVWNQLVSVASVQRLLIQENVDVAALERVLDRMGDAAAEPMLDSLEAAENLTLRRRLLSRLGEMGSSLGPPIAARLPGKPWYVQRNLLLLMGGISPWPPGFSPHPYASHPDPRVRREAYKLLLTRPEGRAESVIAAVEDQDAGIVRLGLSVAVEGSIPSVVPHLLACLDAHHQDGDLVVLGIRVLGVYGGANARTWLLDKALTRPRWFRRRRLVPKSPVLLATLAALAARWIGDPDAAGVLKLAADHGDPEIRAVARATPA